MKPKALDEHIRSVDPWKSFHEFPWKSFAVNAQVRPRRVELLEIVTLLKLASKFEVVEDTKDSLNDPYSLWHLQTMLSKEGYELLRLQRNVFANK